MCRPRMSSVTVSTITRLLDVHVASEKRSQDGDGRCNFRVLADQNVHDRIFLRFKNPSANPEDYIREHA